MLAGIFVYCVSFAPVVWTLTKALPQREALAHKTGSQEDAKKSEWEFATNWSLPPEEILEFCAAGIFGWQTGDPNVPYWGRTGRTLGWEQHHRGLMSLRQNAHYLGLLQWVFAIYAIAWAIRAGRRAATEDRQGASGKGHGVENTDRRTEPALRPAPLAFSQCSVSSLQPSVSSLAGRIFSSGARWCW